MKLSTTAKSMIPDGVKGGFPLCLLERPTGSIPVPSGFGTAEAADHQAREAYETGDYRRAAEIFFTVAATLSLTSDRPYAEAFAANRILSYFNAAISLIMADTPEEAHRRLSAAAAADPVCREGIEGILNDLSKHGSDSSLPPSPAPKQSPHV